MYSEVWPFGSATLTDNLTLNLVPGYIRLCSLRVPDYTNIQPQLLWYATENHQKINETKMAEKQNGLHIDFMLSQLRNFGQRWQHCLHPQNSLNKFWSLLSAVDATKFGFDRLYNLGLVHRSR